MSTVSRALSCLVVFLVSASSLGCNGTEKQIQSVAQKAVERMRPNVGAEVKVSSSSDDAGRADVEWEDGARDALDIVKEGGEFVVEQCLDENLNPKFCFANQGSELPTSPPPGGESSDVAQGEEVEDCILNIVAPDVFSGLCANLLGADEIDRLLYRICRNSSSVVACLPRPGS